MIGLSASGATESLMMRLVKDIFQFVRASIRQTK